MIPSSGRFCLGAAKYIGACCVVGFLNVAIVHWSRITWPWDLAAILSIGALAGVFVVHPIAVRRGWLG